MTSKRDLERQIERLELAICATAEDVANAMHIHPTLPESINSAAGGVHEPS